MRATRNTRRMRKNPKDSSDPTTMMGKMVRKSTMALPENTHATFSSASAKCRR